MLALVASSALAFSAPATGRVAPRSSVNMMVKSKALPFLEAPPALDGSRPGDQGFDPIKCSEYVSIDWLREAELKHARVAMLATVGFIATDLGLTAPGAPTGFSSVAAHDMAVEKGAMLVLFLAASTLEILGGIPKMLQLFNKEVTTNMAPGAYGFDPLNFGKGNSQGDERMQLAEIKNGRLAMLAFSGMVTQAVLYDKGFPYF